jgi:hypothetical protein
MHVSDARLIYDLGRIKLSIEGKNIRNYHYILRQRYVEPIRHVILTMRGSL